MKPVPQTIYFDPDLLARLIVMVGLRNRSAFVREAVRRALDEREVASREEQR